MWNESPTLIGVIVFVAAVLMSVIGTDLQAAARADDCLTAPNASSPRGQHWSYRIDRQNNRKCWYLHSTLGLLHRPAKASDLHAASSTAGAPMSGSSAGSAPHLRHSRKLVVKPKLAPPVIKAVQQSPRSISQEFPMRGSTQQGDRSQPTDVIAAPGTTLEPAMLGVAVADAAGRTDADDAKPAAATVEGAMADEDAVRPDEDDAKPIAATVVGAVADADAVQPDPNAPNSDGGGLIAERIKSTQMASPNALKTPLQMFFLLVFGVASGVFLIFLWIMHRRDTVLVEYPIDYEQPDGPPPWRRQSAAMRPQNGATTEPPRPNLGDFKLRAARHEPIVHAGHAAQIAE